MDENKSMGRVAFEAYVKERAGYTYDNKPIPRWDELSAPIQGAWERAADSVVHELEQRQRRVKDDAK